MGIGVWGAGPHSTRLSPSLESVALPVAEPHSHFLGDEALPTREAADWLRGERSIIPSVGSQSHTVGGGGAWTWLLSCPLGLGWISLELRLGSSR